MSAAVASAQGRLEIAKRELAAAERAGNPSRLEHARRNVAEAAEDLADVVDAESRARHPSKAAPTRAAVPSPASRSGLVTAPAAGGGGAAEGEPDKWAKLYPRASKATLDELRRLDERIAAKVEAVRPSMDQIKAEVDLERLRREAR